MYKDKEVKKNVKDIFLSMCDVKIGPSINTDQGKIAGDKGPIGNKGFIAD
jgi:hypothetical protein